MRRILFAFMAGLLLGTSLAAQSGGFSQNGKVTQELQAEGLCIAHPALPLNSQAKVVNIATGKEIEVTITRRIPASSQRIADLSPSAWRELGLNANSEVKIYTNAFLRPTGGASGTGGGASGNGSAASTGGSSSSGTNNGSFSGNQPSNNAQNMILPPPRYPQMLA